jgi:phosphorylase superfamily protein
MKRDTGSAPGITVIAATRLEARPVRRALREVQIIEAGVGLSRLGGRDLGEAVVSCGVAGAVRAGVPTGAVIIPRLVLRMDGGWITCDPLLVDALAAAARELGLEPELGPLGTASTIVRGTARTSWAERGCVAVDMETGLLTAPRIAAVRVVLDTPERDLSEVWQWPPLVFARPSSWGEALWLMRAAPRCAARAAAVLATGLRLYAGMPPPSGEAGSRAGIRGKAAGPLPPASPPQEFALACAL